ncbi:MAG: AraC family transcriptional regulator [Bacteroidetes bacterium HGW-Bacteroidetes-2]|jgi:effector-binding domain-containing protein|nr:MAG: AraC family transcriptional regulator [Bacteroidetes bacterium HGW-Bacteroidetes-2]
MKILKYLFFLILILFIGVAVYFGTQDGNFAVSETKTIDAPVEVVFQNINDYRNWETWGSWMEDETIKINYPESTSGEGASYSWKSKKDGEGAMQTLSIIPNTSLQQKIIFNGTLEDEGYPVVWSLEPIENGSKTKVTWSMQGTLGLFEKIYFATQNINLEEEISEMYAKSLENLNSVLLQKMDVYSISVDGITGYSGGYYLYNTTAAKQTEISEKIAQMIKQIQLFMEENTIPAQGNPFVTYMEWDEINNSAIFTVGIPTKDRVILPDGSPVISGFMESSTALKTTLKGKYTNLTQAWEVAQKYISEKNIAKDNTLSPFEVYRIQYPQEKNPAYWVTEIYIPLETQEANSTNL